MREVVLRVPAAALDDVLDRLLPLLPGGVRQADLPDGRVELRMRAARLPETDVIGRAVEFVPYEIEEESVSDDWRERRLADHRPRIIGRRLIVRPPWAPAAGPGLVDVVLEETAAFGAGTHPTTRACLELLLTMQPRGAFADLGSGSGVLAIVARLLGWDPVIAVDVAPASVDAAAANAAANGVGVETRVGDLLHQPPPPAEGFAANVPREVHLALAAGWRGGEPPAQGIISGIDVGQVRGVVEAYAACRLTETERRETHGWVVSRLARR